MKVLRGMKGFSFLLSFIFIVSFTHVNTYAEDIVAQTPNKSLTIRTIISGDPSVILTANASITLGSTDKSIVLKKADIMSGTTVVEDVPAGTYSFRTKNIQTAGYSVVITLNGKEVTSIDLDPETNPELEIEMCYSKQEFEDLEHDNLNADNEADFYQPVYGPYECVLEDADCDDDSQRLQEAIDEVNQNNGGTLTINSGDYYIENINMKSNVHIKVASGVSFQIADHTVPNAKVKKGYVFVFNAEELIENVSIEAIDPNERYTINLDTNKYDTTFAFSCNTVRNFKISDADIHGDYKAYQKIGVGSGVIDGLNVVASNGVISNCHSDNVLYGYGLVQIQAGENLLFKNLSSVGGVTLRIENGFVQFAGDNTPRVNDIYGRNIECKNGHYAFMCEDHGIPIGYFNVQGVRSESCLAAVEVGSGNSDSVVKDVSAVYGEDAQLKTKDFFAVPVELTSSELITPDERDPINFGKPNPIVYKGPAVAAVILTAASRISFDDSEVKSCEGFKYQANGGKVLRLKSLTLNDGTFINEENWSFSGLEDSYEYTGSEIIPDITITYGEQQLEKNKDYIIECSNNVEIGTATMVVKFKREYKGNFSRTFQIVEATEDQQPGEQQPGEQQPGEQQPGEQQPGEQQPGEQQPGEQNPEDQVPEGQVPEAEEIEDQDTEDQVVENQTVEDQKTEDQKTEDQKTEDQTVEDQKTEDQTVEDQKTEDQTVEDQKTEDQTIEDQKTEDQTVEVPVSKDKVTENKVTKDNGPTTGEEEKLPIVSCLLLFGTLIMGCVALRKRKVAR